MDDFLGEGKSKNWYADARLIILAIFFAGLCLRLVNLGKIPFNTAEAQNAYAAFLVANGLSTSTAASPVYEGLSAPTFFVLGASPFFARFWPALAGASLALVPLFLRRRVGRCRQFCWPRVWRLTRSCLPFRGKPAARFLPRSGSFGRLASLWSANLSASGSRWPSHG